MPGTVVVHRDLSGAKDKESMKTRFDGVSGQKTKGRGSVEITAAAGSHSLQVTLGGFRTNTVAVQVSEGGRRYARVLPGSLGGMQGLPVLGLLSVVIGLVRPGSVYRLHLD